MTDPAVSLKELKKEHDYLVGIDSDGCAFDSMEIKLKECFIPNIIDYWDLQACSKYVRETVEFVTLYSKTRGINRFPALLRVFDLLAERDEVKKRGVQVPKAASLRQWVQTETRLGNAALEKIVAEGGDAVLAQALEWSKAVNRAIAKIVRNLPPFPLVRECLQKMSETADIIVVSQTPTEALHREWREHGIDRYVKAIAGQEMGSKTQHLAYAIEGRYSPDHVLMIGDAPGDLEAAKDNGVHFYPINPGNEDASWQHLYESAYERFVSGRYAGEYEKQLIAEFEGGLADTPPWRREPQHDLRSTIPTEERVESLNAR